MSAIFFLKLNGNLQFIPSTLDRSVYIKTRIRVEGSCCHLNFKYEKTSSNVKREAYSITVYIMTTCLRQSADTTAY